jgi:Uma2 family endonuclease
MQTVSPSMPTSTVGGPTWEIAHLFPNQGMWSEEEYLDLKGNRLIEFTHGHVEFLPMPTTTHQLIVAWLYGTLLNFIAPSKLGTVLFAPLRVKIKSGKYREPDVVFMLAAHAARILDEFWQGADLVMEVVSNDDRSRDLETKRREYAEAKIPEYWIVDPQQLAITVLRLEKDTYAVDGEYRPGEQARSVLLPGFVVDVTAVFSQRP